MTYVLDGVRTFGRGNEATVSTCGVFWTIMSIKSDKMNIPNLEGLVDRRLGLLNVPIYGHRYHSRLLVIATDKVRDE